MVRPLAALFVSVAVLAHALAWPAATGASGAHACCVRLSVQQQCRTIVSCCPASERRQPGTVPPGSNAQGTSPLLTLTIIDATAASLVPVVSAATLDAHALLRANAPPPLLYLKHLTLLV
jgi:hypothetical protein